jgi:uncharacterized protein YqjF (DUF2071 family)
MENDTFEAQLALRLQPSHSHIMYQTWSRLLFLHWRWNVAELQSKIPDGLRIETYDGSAWLGVVPFFMRSIRPRYLPAVPWISWFLELNVRTYVIDKQGRPGVWFFSLDCNQPTAVWAARRFFYLPYMHARMTAHEDTAGFIHYTCQRSGTSQVSTFQYAIDKSVSFAEPRTLDFFLLERYLLHSRTPHGLRVGQVHHVPYPISQVKLERWDDHTLLLNGFSSPGRPPDHVCGSMGVRVQVYPIRP